MIIAVLEKRAMVPIGAMDIYLSTVGGMRLTDPSSDLAVAMAMASAFITRPLPATTVVIGEVGLAGDLRRVTGMERRLAEAARLGFTTALVPAGCGPAPTGLRTLEAATIGEALRTMVSLTESRLRVVPAADGSDHHHRPGGMDRLRVSRPVAGGPRRAARAQVPGLVPVPDQAQGPAGVPVPVGLRVPAGLRVRAAEHRR